MGMHTGNKETYTRVYMRVCARIDLRVYTKYARIIHVCVVRLYLSCTVWVSIFSYIKAKQFQIKQERIVDRWLNGKHKGRLDRKRFEHFKKHRLKYQRQFFQKRTQKPQNWRKLDTGDKNQKVLLHIQSSINNNNNPAFLLKTIVDIKQHV